MGDQVDSILNGLKETMRLAMDYSVSVTNEELEQLREIAFGVCKSDLEANAYRSAIEAAAREETTEEFEQAYAANTVNITAAKVKQFARYKEFLSELNAVKEALDQAQTNSSSDGNATDSNINVGVDVDADDGTQQMGNLISDIDPITKKPLEDPCRNRICGHVYSMTSVQALLKNNLRTHCPIVGCTNKKVNLEDLVPDKELARKLYLQRAQQKKR